MIRKRTVDSKEDFVVGYLMTDTYIMKDPNEGNENNEQVIAFIHSHNSEEILIIARNSDNPHSEADLENQDVKMFILPWPPIKPRKDDKKIRDIVSFLIKFAETTDAWIKFEASMPSVQDFIRDSFLKPEDLENLKFLNQESHLRLVQNFH